MNRRRIFCGLLAGLAGVFPAAPGARGAPGQPFSAPFAIGHADDHSPGITPPLRLLATASDGTGGLALAWTYTPSKGSTGVELALRRAGRSLPSARTIYRSERLRGQPVLAMDARGDTLVAFGVTAPRRVMVVDVSASGHVGRATAISPSGVSAGQPAVAETLSGAATVVFARDAGSGVPNGLMAATRAPGGHFAAATSISAGGAISGSPTVTVADDGTATAAWNVAVPAGTAVQPQAEIAVAPAGGTFGAPEMPASCASFGFALAGNPGGDNLLTCQGSDGQGGYSVLAAARSGVRGTFGPPVTIPERWDLIRTSIASAVSPARQGLVVVANGDGDHAGVLRTATWRPGQSAPTPGDTIRQATPVARARFGGYTYPSTPATVFVHGRPLIAWGESQPENDGRDGSGNLAAVTPEFASGDTTATIGPGRILARAAYPAPEGQLDAFVLVGGGSGRVYAAWLTGTTVMAARLISARR